MPYGSDVTEGIPYVLSNPSGATNYSATGVNYDMAIAGLPFFIGATDDSPYRRVTAQYRKQGGLDRSHHSIMALVLNTLNQHRMSHFVSSTQNLKVVMSLLKDR